MAITKIATVTVPSGGQAALQFLSIPGTFTDLWLKISARGSNSTVYFTTKIRFNGATSDANMSNRFLQGPGSGSPSAGTGSLFLVGDIAGNSSTSNTFGTADVYIPNYSDSTNKTATIDSTGENNSAENYTQIIYARWADNSAITSLSVQPVSGTFLQYSTATLYGITKGSLAGVTVS